MPFENAIWELYDSKSYELSVVNAGANLLDDLVTFKGADHPVALPLNIENIKVEESGSVATESMDAMELSNKALLFLGGDPHAKANYKFLYRNNDGNIDTKLVDEIRKSDFSTDKSIPAPVIEELKSNFEALSDYVEANKGMNVANTLKSRILELASDKGDAEGYLTRIRIEAGLEEGQVADIVTGKQKCSDPSVLSKIASALDIDETLLVSASKLDGVAEPATNQIETNKNLDQQGSINMPNPDQKTQEPGQGVPPSEPKAPATPEVDTNKAMPNVIDNQPKGVSLQEFETIKSQLDAQKQLNETLKANQDALREELTWKEYLAEASAFNDLPCTREEAATLLKAVDKVGSEIHTSKALEPAEAVDAPALLRRILKGASEQYTQKTKERGTSASGMIDKSIQEKIDAEIQRSYGEKVADMTSTEKSIAHSRAVAKLISESKEFAKQYQEHFKN